MTDALKAAQAYLLGFKSTEEVAAECRRLGVRGVVGDCRRCAVARLLMEKTGAAMPPVVNPGGSIWFGGFLLGSFPCPPAVTQFANRFDEGRFPDLVNDTPARA